MPRKKRIEVDEDWEDGDPHYLDGESLGDIGHTLEGAVDLACRVSKELLESREQLAALAKENERLKKVEAKAHEMVSRIACWAMQAEPGCMATAAAYRFVSDELEHVLNQLKEPPHAQ